MKRQKGFAVIELLIVLVIVAAVGGVGWVVWQRQQDKSSGTANPQTTQAEPSTNCGSQTSEPITENGGADTKEPEWKTIQHTKVFMPKWGVTMTIPQSLAGKAVCRLATGGQYEFSTKAVVDDPACVKHYRTTELSLEGVELWQYSLTTQAETQINNATGTLFDHYKLYKATDGDYFEDPDIGRKYHKVGGYFYVMVGDPYNSPDKHKAARVAACKNEAPDFKNQFVEAAATLKQTADPEPPAPV